MQVDVNHIFNPVAVAIDVLIEIPTLTSFLDTLTHRDDKIDLQLDKASEYAVTIINNLYKIGAITRVVELFLAANCIIMQV